jgi:hypothetical protein
MTMKIVHTWRVATEEEISSGLDSNVNPGMILVSTEEVDIDEGQVERIDISLLTDEQILELKTRLNSI